MKVNVKDNFSQSLELNNGVLETRLKTLKKCQKTLISEITVFNTDQLINEYLALKTQVLTELNLLKSQKLKLQKYELNTLDVKNEIRKPKGYL